jgi:hypothetical protein
MLRNSRKFGRVAGILGFITLAVITETIFAAGIKKWINDEGQVHFGDQPPASVSATAVKVPRTPKPDDRAASIDDPNGIEGQLRRMQAAKATNSRNRRNPINTG